MSSETGEGSELPINIQKNGLEDSSATLPPEDGEEVNDSGSDEKLSIYFEGKDKKQIEDPSLDMNKDRPV